MDLLNRFILSISSDYSWLYKGEDLKGLYGSIGVQISDSYLTPEIASDINNLGFVLQTGIPATLKIMEKILLIQD